MTKYSKQPRMTARPAKARVVAAFPKHLAIPKHIFLYSPTTKRCIVCDRSERAACHRGIR